MYSTYPDYDWADPALKTPPRREQDYKKIRASVKHPAGTNKTPLKKRTRLQKIRADV